MLFILLFVVLTLIFPLTVEISQRGSDNILARTGREVATSGVVLSAQRRVFAIRVLAASIGDAVTGLLTLVVVIVLIMLVLRIVATVLPILHSVWQMILGR